MPAVAVQHPGLDVRHLVDERVDEVPLVAGQQQVDVQRQLLDPPSAITRPAVLHVAEPPRHARTQPERNVGRKGFPEVRPVQLTVEILEEALLLGRGAAAATRAAGRAGRFESDRLALPPFPQPRDRTAVCHVAMRRGSEYGNSVDDVGRRRAKGFVNVEPDAIGGKRYEARAVVPKADGTKGMRAPLPQGREERGLGKPAQRKRELLIIGGAPACAAARRLLHGP